MCTINFLLLILLQTGLQVLAKESYTREHFISLLDSTKTEVNKLKKVVTNFYDANIEKRFHGRIYSEESLQGLKRKFANVLMRNDNKFIFGFTGDSVAAGHDCEHTQAYPSVFEKYFAPISKAAGLQLEVRNAAVGDNPCFPYNICVQAFVGDDCDVVTWDQLMDGKQFSARYVEAFIRHSLAMKSQPAVLITNGVPETRSSRRLARIRSFAIGDDGDEHNLVHLFGQYGVHWVSASESLVGTENDSRFSHAQLMDYGKSYGNKHWHPGPHGHRLTGLVLAINYADVMVQVLKDLATADDLENIPFLQGELVDPSSILSKYHSRFEDQIDQFQCATTFEPRYSSPLHLEHFVSPDSGLVDHRLVSLNNRSEIEKTRGGKHWDILAKTEKLAKGMVNGAVHGNLDRKFTILGRYISGPISFIFNSSYSGTETPFWFCAPKDKQNALPKDYTISIDGIKAPFISSFDTCFGPGGVEITKGTHTVTVEVTAKTTSPSNIAYALWWGPEPT